jgi:voltage-gated sodium channel
VANFGSLPAALLTLFRIVTLDNWGDIFLAQLAHVSAVKVAIYFVTFIIFGTMIILNLFIGIIMNSMAEMHAEIAARDRAQHEGETRAATLEDELTSLERDVVTLQTRLAGLRRTWRGASPPRGPAETLEERPA